MKGGDEKGVVTAGPPAINLRRINFSLRKINQNFAPERDRTLHQGKKYKEECSVKSEE